MQYVRNKHSVTPLCLVYLPNSSPHRQPEAPLPQTPALQRKPQGCNLPIKGATTLTMFNMGDGRFCDKAGDARFNESPHNQELAVIYKIVDGLPWLIMIKEA